jgi:tetratricopeptide (TPR) repeat protein
MKSTRTLLALVAGAAFMACASGRTMAFQASTGGGLQAGISLYQQGKYGEAAATLQGVGGVEGNAYLAASLAKQGQFEAALGPANAALEGDATHAVAVAALGEALFGLGRHDDCIARMGDALGKRNDLPYAYYWRGQSHSKKRQPDRMVSDYEAFVRLAPNAPEAETVRQLLAALR